MIHFLLSWASFPVAFDFLVKTRFDRMGVLLGPNFEQMETTNGPNKNE